MTWLNITNTEIKMEYFSKSQQSSVFMTFTRDPVNLTGGIVVSWYHLLNHFEVDGIKHM